MSVPDEELPVLLGRVIQVASILGMSDRKGWVTVRWGPMRGKLSPTEARAHALAILECAEAAQTDQMLYQYADKVFPDDPRSIRFALELIRSLRTLRGTPIDHTSGGTQ